MHPWAYFWGGFLSTLFKSLFWSNLSLLLQNICNITRSCNPQVHFDYGNSNLSYVSQSSYEKIRNIPGKHLCYSATLINCCLLICSFIEVELQCGCTPGTFMKTFRTAFSLRNSIWPLLSRHILLKAFMVLKYQC